MIFNNFFRIIDLKKKLRVLQLESESQANVFRRLHYQQKFLSHDSARYLYEEELGIDAKSLAKNTFYFLLSTKSIHLLNITL